MQVVKGDQNGYPVPGRIAVPPWPWGYKYGGLAFHIGDWATGRQTFTIKELTVRKPKLWFWWGQTEWNRPGQWKRFNERITNR